MTRISSAAQRVLRQLAKRKKPLESKFGCAHGDRIVELMNNGLVNGQITYDPDGVPVTIGDILINNCGREFLDDCDSEAERQFENRSRLIIAGASSLILMVLVLWLLAK
jgi:hypothetical protein